jgi:large subunit ribosomal protein L21
MYAIIRDGSRQFKVQAGQELDIDFREAAAAGDAITFGDVLCVAGGDDVKIGKPLLSGASVAAEDRATSQTTPSTSGPSSSPAG